MCIRTFLNLMSVVMMLSAPMFWTGCALDRSGAGCVTGTSDEQGRCLELAVFDAGADSGFDASQIPPPDAGFDAGFDADLPDAGEMFDAEIPLDAGFDAGVDGGIDAGTDAGVDAGTDAGFDSGVDAGTDAGFDAGTDAGFDSGVDAGYDAGMDAGFDAGVDAGFDAGYDAGPPPRMDAGHDAGFDAGTDAGFDAGFDAGYDAGPPSGPLVIHFGSASGPAGIVFRVVWNEPPPVGRRETGWFYRNCTIVQAGSSVDAYCSASQLVSGRTVEFFPFDDTMMSSTCNATTCPSLCSGTSCPGYPGAYSATYLGMAVPSGDFTFNTDPTGSPGPAPGDSAWISFPLP